MKKLLLFIPLVVIGFLSCEKEQVVGVPDEIVSVAKGTVDYTNPNPTWIQVTAPILMPARWSAYFVPLGYTAGIQTTYKNSFTTAFDTVVIRWHLHVGLRNFNSQLKPDVIDRSFYYINGGNGGEQYSKPIPNKGVMGDYDIVDTIVLPIGNNSVTPEIHSSATNGWLSSPFFITVTPQ